MKPISQPLITGKAPLMNNTIRVQRAIHKISQQQLADKIGVRVQTIHAIENNKYVPGLLIGMRLALYFKIPVEELFIRVKEDMQMNPGQQMKQDIQPMKASKMIRIMPYRTCDFCKLYKTSSKTFIKRLIPFKDEIGPRIGHFYYPRQVRIILERLGHPEVIN